MIYLWLYLLLHWNQNFTDGDRHHCQVAAVTTESQLHQGKDNTQMVITDALYN